MSGGIIELSKNRSGNKFNDGNSGHYVVASRPPKGMTPTDTNADTWAKRIALERIWLKRIGLERIIL